MTDSDDKNSTTTIQLMSTQTLRTMLDAGSDVEQLIAAADGDVEGVVGVDEAGAIEVLEKNSLDALMAADYQPTPRTTPQQSGTDVASEPRPARDVHSAGKPAGRGQPPPPVRRIELPAGDGDDDSDSLELVDTMMLRIILDEKRVAEGKAPRYQPQEDDGNPYNSVGPATKPAADKTADKGGYNPYSADPGRKR